MILPSYESVKCNNCDKNGFVVKNGIATLCSCRKQYEQELSASDILLKSGLLTENSNYEDFKKLIDYDFSMYRGNDKNGNIKRIKKYVDEFDNPNKPFKNMHFYIWGGQGTQKSYTLKGMLSLLAKKGKSVYYTFTKDLISLIIDSERNEDSQKKLNYIQNVDCLILDEFDPNRVATWKSGYKENVLITWLKERLEIIKKSTWIISNLSIDEQKNGSFGDMYYDLLCRECRYGTFEFTDKYSDNLSKEEMEEIFNSIWDD